MQAIAAKKISFDAAHWLPDYDGKCSQVHGHHWVVEVAAKGKVSDSGMVADFSQMKEFLSLMKERFDHSTVNNVIACPTAENIAKYIHDEFNLWCVARGLAPAWVDVWETEDSRVRIEGGYEVLPHRV